MRFFQVKAMLYQMSLGSITNDNSIMNSVTGCMRNKYLLEVIFCIIVEALFSICLIF